MASDRPISRQVIKLVAQLLLGRRRAHYHAWLPSLRIADRGEGVPGRVLYRGASVLDLKDTRTLQERAGPRILIIGSGPSVKDAWLHNLPGRCALLLNGAINLIGEGVSDPLAVAIEDERFVWRHSSMVARLVPRDVPMLLSVGAIRALCDIDRGLLEGRPVILIDDIRKPYGAPRRRDADLGELDFVSLSGGAGFSAESAAGVFQGGSVVVSALQFALATNAAEIGFIGVDIGNAEAARFYEDEGNQAHSGVAGAQKRILDHIALARDVAAARGVRLVNHSAVSALRSIGLGFEPLEVSAA